MPSGAQETDDDAALAGLSGGETDPQSVAVDVLVVGGGPAGLATAWRLTLSEGLRVLVVHQDREIGRPVRTSGGSWVRDLKALGVPDHLYHRIDTLEIRSDRKVARHAMQRHPMAVLDVTGLYRRLAACAREGGAVVLTGAKFEGLRPAGDGHLCTLRVRGRALRQVEARYVIDASGQACAVLDAAGLRPRPSRVGVGVEAEYALEGGPDRTAVLFMGRDVPAGYGWIFPAPHGAVRIGVGVIRPDVSVSPRTVLDAVVTPALLARHGLTLGPLIQTNAGIIPSTPFDRRLVFGRILRVGDAANVATPTVGEGIRLAIDQGWRLGTALRQQMLDGDRGALKRWQRNEVRLFALNYRFGFMANRRMARYGPEDWDRSVARAARLSEDEISALIRCEFTPGTMMRALIRQVAHRLRARAQLET